MILYTEKPVIHTDTSSAELSSNTGSHAPYDYTIEQVHISSKSDNSIYARVNRKHPNSIVWDELIESCNNSVCDKLITYSPTLAADLFGIEPGNWLKRGYTALNDLCKKLLPVLDKCAIKILFQPHARHVLSDYSICLKFMQEHKGEPFGIALAPSDLIEPVMAEDIDDHMLRIFEYLGSLTKTVILSDVAISENGNDMVAALPGEGLVDFSLIGKLLLESVADDAGVILTGAAAESKYINIVTNLLKCDFK